MADSTQDSPTTRTPHNPFVERSPEDEQLHRKQRLAMAFRIFGRLGFDEGVAGHITARDPLREDCFWVNPFGMSFKQIRVADLILVDHDGRVVEGHWPVNQAAFAIHSQVHAARPDVIAAAHSHSVHGKAFSSLHRPLRPLTQDACIFFEDHVFDPDYGGVANDIEEGKRIATALARRWPAGSPPNRCSTGSPPSSPTASRDPDRSEDDQPRLGTTGRSADGPVMKNAVA